jgi:hypothetical protein
MGVIALAFCWIPVVGVLLAAVAVLCAGLALSRRSSGLGIAGIILGVMAGIIGMFVSILAVAAATALSTGPHPDTGSLTDQHADRPGTQSHLSPELPTISQSDAFLNGLDGTYRVGTDVQPGTYISSGPRPSSFMPVCMWERLAGTSGQFDDFIAGDASPGQTILTVEPTDRYVKITGCNGPLTVAS